jgi:hypothetical protein
MNVSEVLARQGLSADAFGAAYFVLLGTLFLTSALFLLSRTFLVVTPNRASRDYGLYVVVVLVSIVVATVLENALLPDGAATLQYAALPQLTMLLIVHLWIYHKHEPWLVALGAAAVTGSAAALAIVAAVSKQIYLPHWLAAALLSCLLVYLWRHSISTKRAFVNAQSIYIESKEKRAKSIKPQKPWLGLPQWVALIAASIALAAINSMLRGSGLAEITAVQVLGSSAFLLSVTALVCAVPAATYWLARKHWMPELTRFAWLVWLVVGFAYTYGNFLNGLDRA